MTKRAKRRNLPEKRLTRSGAKPLRGVDGFIKAVEHYAAECEQNNQGVRQFVLRISDDFAFIRLQDVKHPLKFFHQISGKPPVRFGKRGFHPNLVDDEDPARHYTAFVFVGYWLPLPLAWLVLIAWEMLGFVRYGFHWSAKDVRNGQFGLWHGRAVRRNGASVLARLIKRDLTVDRGR